MCQIFYKDKDITFTRNYSGNPENIAIFANSPGIGEVVEALSNGNVEIVTSDPEESFGSFCNKFKVVKAAGGVVRNPAAETLMIFRKGVWDLPKGKLEAGERIEECAVREVTEECGIAGLKNEGLRCVTYHIYDTYGEWVVKPTYWYDMSCSGDCNGLVPQQEEDITVAEWVPENELRKKLDNSYSTIRYVLLNQNKQQTNL